MTAHKQFFEIIHADRKNDGKADGGPEGITPADPIPESEHVFCIDTKLRNFNRIGGKRNKVLGNMSSILGALQEPFLSGKSVSDGFLSGESFGSNDE